MHIKLIIIIQIKFKYFYTLHSYPIGLSFELSHLFLFPLRFCPYLTVHTFLLDSISHFGLVDLAAEKIMYGVSTEDLPVAVRALYPLDHGDPRFKHLFTF